MKALLFPGQGSQIVGMGSAFYKNYDFAKKAFNEADEKLNFKISKIILEGPDSELKLTKNTQPAIMLISYIIFNILKKEFGVKINDFKYFAGHSLGEYSALVCANSLIFSDALYLLHERGKAMQEAVPIGEGGMLAVLGLEVEEINKYILELKNKGICEIANDNAKGQIILSGNIQSINNLKDLLKKDNKKSILLPVSAPFHCSLMKDAAEKMREKIDSTNFKVPELNLIANVTARPEKDPQNIKSLLIKQIYSKVRWRESIMHMAENGIAEFIEIGPGKVLSGLIKRIIKNSKSININTIDDMKNII
jgi:[acyl-carrier-protein] S-malonyltransferase